MEKEDERIIRETLWMSHGCAGMYGDDGEMQCGTIHGKFGFLDFKRDPINTLIKGSFHKLLSALEAAQKEAEELKTERLVLRAQKRFHTKVLQRQVDGLREDLWQIREAYFKCESEFPSKMDLKEKITIHAEDEKNLWKTLISVFSANSKKTLDWEDKEGALQKVVETARKLVKARREENIIDHGLAADELEEAIDALARTEKEAPNE